MVGCPPATAGFGNLIELQLASSLPEDVGRGGSSVYVARH